MFCTDYNDYFLETNDKELLDLMESKASETVEDLHDIYRVEFFIKGKNFHKVVYVESHKSNIIYNRELHKWVMYKEKAEGIGPGITLGSIDTGLSFDTGSLMVNFSDEAFKVFRGTHAAKEFQEKFDKYSVADLFLLLFAHQEDQNDQEGSLMYELIERLNDEM